MTEPASGPVPATHGLHAMVVHMRQVSQRILAPHLEAGEIGVGDKADIDRRVPVTVGAEVKLLASVANAARRSWSRRCCWSGGLLIARPARLRGDAATFAREVQQAEGARARRGASRGR